MVVLFVKNNYRINLKMLNQLNTHLSKQVPILSQLMDEVLVKASPGQSTPTPDPDPLRFFYFSRMNLAIKFNNLSSKDMLTVDLRLILNQMHE